MKIIFNFKYVAQAFKACALLIFGLVLSASVHAKWYKHQFDVMGTRAQVEFESASPELAQKLIQSVVDEMNRIDKKMSPFKETSELTLINNKASLAPLKISKEMFDILKRSMEFAELTNGAFDISFSSIGYLYDYRLKQKPTQEELERLKNAINYKKIKLNAHDQTVYFEDKRIRIDLGGIAKGYAVDNCIKLLQKTGINNAYVNAGGDSRIIGKKKERVWYIGVRHPRDEKKLLANLPLEDVAVSTSGDYERYFEQDGVRYHHIIDPTTGESSKSAQSATIIADDAITADALSTSLFVLGVEKGMALINDIPGVSAILVNSYGKMFVSKDLESAH